mgnify:CR=1 FL=1
MSANMTIPEIPWTPPGKRLEAGSDRFPERRCIAHSKNSGAKVQCKNPPMRGSMVCRHHGGATPVARQAAKARLLAMCEPAFKVLQDCMEDPNAEWADKIRAANSVLDRAGFTAKAQLTVKHQQENLDGMTRDQLVARGERIMHLLKERSEDVIDAVVESEANGTEDAA